MPSAMTKRGKLGEGEITAFIGAHPGWTKNGEALAKTFLFEAYEDGLAFAVKVGFAAEKRDHHPDLFVGWRKVEVGWSTHDAGGITALDVEMAEASDKIFDR
jgi:4a-hydroxytetrahydrobiopterin dehydratase